MDPGSEGRKDSVLPDWEPAAHFCDSDARGWSVTTDRLSNDRALLDGNYSDVRSSMKPHLRTRTASPMPVEALWKRTIRRVLEMVVALALMVFVFSRPNTNAGLRYFIGSVAVLFLCLSLLRKWP